MKITAKRVLFLLDNNFENDRRVYCEAVTLINAGYEVTLIGCKASHLPERENKEGISVIRIFEPDIFDIKKPRCHHNYAKRIQELVEFEIVHAHDQTMLNLGRILKQRNSGSVLIYDSHELFHEWPINLSKVDDKWLALKSFVVRKIETYREKKNAHHVDRFITVGDAVGEVLNTYFKLKHPIAVIRNLPYRNTDFDNTDVLRNHFKIPKDTKIIVYMGKSIYRHTLNLEQVLDEFRNVEGVAIVFISNYNPRVQQFMEYVENENFNNVYFHPKVTQAELNEYLSSADIGLVPVWNKKDLSYWLALGNKLFDYIQSGLPILTTEQPEYKRLIDKHKCGVCVNPDSSEAYIEGYKSILSNYEELKQNSIKASAELCWEREEKKLVELYNQL